MEQIQNRIRVNLKQTSKGVLYFELTVELYNKSNAEVVAEAMDLKEKIEKAIPKQNGGETNEQINSS